MNIYRHLGLSLIVFIGITSSTVFSNYVMPLPLAVFTAVLFLYYYLLWTRGLAQKNLLYVYLIGVPLLCPPVAYLAFWHAPQNPNVYSSLGAAMVAGIALNLLVFGKRAYPPKRQTDAS
ncbi:MAG: hypothetical protein LBH03_02355 [Holophagales bacterium]|jgi:hypothetical protein|nr:hypothetical protein [Holophagales bacterium]